jgi:hypothetical protein
MNRNTKVRGALAAVRRHPARAAAICVPLVAVSVFSGTTMASARPQATLPVPAGAVNAAPAQHVMLFGNNLSGHVAKFKSAPKIAFNEDGCDHNYGSPNQCVPWQIPGSTGAARCAWLESMGFGAVQVSGTNRQDLPEDAQGYACGSGE